MPPRPIRVLFLCLGNICRSPLAEGLFRAHVAAEPRLALCEIDSAGISAAHRGEPPDPRSIAVAKAHGLDICAQRSRPLEPGDLERFDFIVAMDRRNRRDAAALGPFPEERLLLMRHFDPESAEHDVPDPWYEGPGGFDEVYAMLHRAMAPLAEHILGVGPRRRSGG